MNNFPFSRTMFSTTINQAGMRVSLEVCSRFSTIICLIVVIAHGSTSEVLAQNLELPKLPYDYDALEPHIDEQTMQIHHMKHHMAYLNTLNGALTALRADESTKHIAKMGVDKALQHLDEVPEALRGPRELYPLSSSSQRSLSSCKRDTMSLAVRNGGGGFVNHVLFWNSMTANGTKAPESSEPLGQALDAAFGSFMAFKDAFHDKATKVFGSGWAWLVYDHTAATVAVVTTPNQDSPTMQKGLTPLLGLDCWEHAYYLKYQNRRPDYVTAFWEVVNWEEVAKRYQAAVATAKSEL